MRTRRSLQAVLAAGLLASALTACSFQAGDLEPIGGEEAVAQGETPGGAAGEDGAAGDTQTIQASHITARIPADWSAVPDQDPWKYIHQIPNDAGGVAGQIRFMPGGTAMGPQESVDWFVGQIKGTGETDDNFAPITTLRKEQNRANTSYTYTSDGRQYVAVVWGLTDSKGAPSLIQLSGQQTLITPDFVAQVDRSLDLTGDWAAPAK